MSGVASMRLSVRWKWEWRRGIGRCWCGVQGRRNRRGSGGW